MERSDIKSLDSCDSTVKKNRTFCRLRRNYSSHTVTKKFAITDGPTSNNQMRVVRNS